MLITKSQEIKFSLLPIGCAVQSKNAEEDSKLQELTIDGLTANYKIRQKKQF